METKGGKRGEGGCAGMNWEIGIDIYTLICIKYITNKNLLYKKNKLKKYYPVQIFFKNKINNQKKKTRLLSSPRSFLQGGLGCGLRMCICYKFLSDADAAGWRATLGEPLLLPACLKRQQLL